MPKLIGVSCVDMNLVVDLPTLRNTVGYADFWSLVQSEMTACPLNSLTERQMETLRAEVGASTVCDSSYSEPPPPPPPPSPSPPPRPSGAGGVGDGGGGGGAQPAADDGDDSVIVIAVVAVVGVVVVGSLIFLGCYCNKKAKRQGNAAAVRVPAVPQPQQMQMGAVPVCQGSVVQGYPVPVQ